MDETSRLERFMDAAERRIEDMSTPTAVALTLGGAAVMVGGIELSAESQKFAGMLVEDAGFCAVVMGAGRRALEAFGIS